MHGSAVKGYALGMEGLIADWYWMRALQYVGNKMLNARAEDVNLDDLRNLNPRLLYPFSKMRPTSTRTLWRHIPTALVMPAIDAEKAIEITKRASRTTLTNGGSINISAIFMEARPLRRSGRRL